MRPVDRGERPTTAGGQRKVYDDYRQARPDLIGRLGAYCSFCEVRVPVPIDAEHIRHQDNNPTLSCEWDNLLLACKNCNSTKGTKVDTAADVAARVWPQTDRTFDVFRYRPEGIVELADIQDLALRARARATADTVGLFRRPGPDGGLTAQQIERATDRRYQERAEAWRMAEDARADLAKADSPELRRWILVSAREKGFWSVWMTVFADDDAMRDALNKMFPGTASDRVEPLPPHCSSSGASDSP